MYKILPWYLLQRLEQDLRLNPQLVVVGLDTCGGADSPLFVNPGVICLQLQPVLSDVPRKGGGVLDPVIVCRGMIRIEVGVAVGNLHLLWNDKVACLCIEALRR